VLWAYRTTKHILAGETPFSLTYGTKAIIPVDICMPTFHTEEIDRDQNASKRPCTRSRKAQVCITAYQQRIKVVHHKKVKPLEFLVGDLVLKRVIQSTKKRNAGKLGPN